MKIIVSSPDKEAEKRLLRVLAEVALEVGRERETNLRIPDIVHKEADDDKDGRRVLPCIDSIE